MSNLTKVKPWFGRGKSLRLAVTSTCLLAFVLFGYDQGVFGGILHNEDWLRQFDHPSDSATGIIVSCYNLGCFTGCVLNFFLGENLGRRRAIWLAMVFVLVGATLQTTAYSVPHLIVGRIITGVGTGIKTSTVPMYQAELCVREKRGRLVAAEVLFVGVGIVIAYWFDFGLSFAGGPIAWRLPLAFQMVFALAVVGIVFGVPESPRWLVNHGRREDAIQVLSDVYDTHREDPYLVAEMEAIDHALSLEGSGHGVFTLFKKDKVRTRYRVFLAWLVQFMNQAGGINLVVYYAPSVLIENVGMEPRIAQILGGCINMMFMFGSILPALALDRMGRRKTMMWGCGSLGICMLFISALLSQANGSNGHAFASASVTFFFLYMLFFGMSVNCVPWVVVPEILPLEARAKGTAIGISSNWIWNFAVVMITPVIINRLQWKAYLIFMATNLLFVPIFYLYYPECSNLGLEDVDYVFSEGRNPVTVAREMQKQLGNARNISRRPSVVPQDNEVVQGATKGDSYLVEKI